MSDLIDRQAAIDALPKPQVCEYMDEFGAGRNSCAYDAEKAIEVIPAANVVPVRLGEWLDGYKMQTCSLCKCRGKKSWTFCPHCGARMIYGERKE